MVSMKKSIMNTVQVRERLLGSWRFVSAESRNASGDASSPLGDDPIGQLTYDASGTVSAQLMRRSQPHFCNDDWQLASAEEKASAWSGYFGYFGTFTVDEMAGTIVHRIDGSWFPNLVGTEQVRHFSLAGNRLTLNAETPWGRVSIVWEKVNVTL
jgi:Lipocalin-like domain